MNNSIPSFKQIWSVSIPIMLSMLAQNIIALTDIIFIGNYASRLDADKAEGMLGAVGMGSIYNYILFMVCFGFATGMQIIISRRNGEKQYHRIGGIMEIGTIFLWILAGVLIVFSLKVSSSYLHFLIKSEEVVAYTKEFIDIRVFGLLFSSTTAAFRAFHVGTTSTKALTYSSVFSTCVNILCNYVLIFGNWGFPELGVTGAAYACIIAEAFGVLVFLFYNRSKEIRRKYRLLYFYNLNLKSLKNILNVSVYVMLQYTISLSTWLTFFIVVEKSGRDFLDASEIVRAIVSFFSIPSWALAAATSTFVSNAIGEGLSSSTVPIIKRMALISLLCAVVSLFILVPFSSFIVSVFTPNLHLVDLTIKSLHVVYGSLIIFALGSVFFNGISGTGRTGVAMVLEFIAIFFYALCIYMVYKYFSHKPEIYWSTEYVYWGSLGIISFLYLKYGGWKKRIHSI